MITLYPYDKHYIALQSDYAHKDAIKALGEYPDRKWDAERRMWLLHIGLWAALVRALGPHLQGSPEFWMGFPEAKQSKPKRQRRRTYQERAEEREMAAVVGQAIVEHKDAWR